jgi:pilus assembly protein CpaF
MVHRRVSFLVTGGTGSGKTTLLSTLLSEVPDDERIVLVEDSGELRPTHPHVVRLEARQPNVEGTGRVDLSDLVRQALRMRPDRIVVGEVRGAEVVDLLGALNTGHEGGCGTVHANSPESLPSRLEALALAAGLGRAALHSQLVAAVQVIVHVARARDGGRRIAAIAVLDRDANGLAMVVPAVVVDEQRRMHEAVGGARLLAVLADAQQTS